MRGATVSSRIRRQAPEATSACVIRATMMMFPALGVVKARTYDVPCSRAYLLMTTLLSRK